MGKRSQSSSLIRRRRLHPDRRAILVSMISSRLSSEMKIEPRIQMKCIWWNIKKRSVVICGNNVAATLRHLDFGANYPDMQYSWRIANKTLYSGQRGMYAMCEVYVDEVMTAPSHLKNGNNWQMVCTRCVTFLNNVATIDVKHIAIRKRTSSGSLYYKYTVFSASSYWL